jgi:hypothetical protein
MERSLVAEWRADRRNCTLLECFRSKFMLIRTHKNRGSHEIYRIE